MTNKSQSQKKVKKSIKENAANEPVPDGNKETFEDLLKATVTFEEDLPEDETSD